ncbi:MAG: 30S ribosomal protein S4 [Planctomycetota bacterium]
MAHHTGPRVKVMRRLGCDLPGFSTKTMSRRPTPPGHAAAMSRRFPKLSEHALRLREKQKLRFHYGLNERQLRRIYQTATGMKGDTGSNMLALLESRLDNLVWRSGFARTIPAARQLVSHGHVNVGEHRAKAPSQRMAPGMRFSLRTKALNREDIRVSVNNPVLEPPPGLKIDLDKLGVEVETLPSREQVPVDIDIQKVIEFYAR